MISSSNMVPINRSPDAGTFVGSPGGAWYKKSGKKWRDLVKGLMRRKLPNLYVGGNAEYNGVGKYKKGEVLD